MFDDSNPRQILRGIGRGLDRRYPPDQDESDSFDDLLQALAERDAETRNGDARNGRPSNGHDCAADNDSGRAPENSEN